MWEEASWIICWFDRRFERISKFSGFGHERVEMERLLGESLTLRLCELFNYWRYRAQAQMVRFLVSANLMAASS